MNVDRGMVGEAGLGEQPVFADGAHALGIAYSAAVARYRHIPERLRDTVTHLARPFFGHAAQTTTAVRTTRADTRLLSVRLLADLYAAGRVRTALMADTLPFLWSHMCLRPDTDAWNARFPFTETFLAVARSLPLRDLAQRACAPQDPLRPASPDTQTLAMMRRFLRVVALRRLADADHPHAAVLIMRPCDAVCVEQGMARVFVRRRAAVLMCLARLRAAFASEAVAACLWGAPTWPGLVASATAT